MITENEATAEALSPPVDRDVLVITLRKPVELGKELIYHELRLREPTGAEMISCGDQRGWDLDLSLISIISGIPKPAVIKIGTKDLMRAREFIGFFFE